MSSADGNVPGKDTQRFITDNPSIITGVLPGYVNAVAQVPGVPGYRKHVVPRQIAAHYGLNKDTEMDSADLLRQVSKETGDPAVYTPPSGSESGEIVQNFPTKVIGTNRFKVRDASGKDIVPVIVSLDHIDLRFSETPLEAVRIRFEVAGMGVDKVVYYYRSNAEDPQLMGPLASHLYGLGQQLTITHLPRIRARGRDLGEQDGDLGDR